MSVTKEELQGLLDGVSVKFKAENEALMAQIKEQNFKATEEQKTALEQSQAQHKAEVDALLTANSDLIKQLIEKEEKEDKAKGTTFLSALESQKSTSFQKMKDTGSGWAQFELKSDKDGQLLVKDAGSHSITNEDAPDLMASVLGSMSATNAMRSQANARIYNMFENTNWIFDLVNLVQASENVSYLTYWEEVAGEGAAAVVPEHGQKPLAQFKWELKSVEYKKVAIMYKITQEFDMDFPRFVSELRSKGLNKVYNAINQAVITDLLSIATAFSATATWTGVNGVPNVNAYDAIMAMAGQVDAATFSNSANVAIMSTTKYWRIQAIKDTTGNYLTMPNGLSNIRLVGNAGFGIDNVIVGDVKEYNLVMRGNPIIKIGLDGEDFSHNRRSVIVEQFYYNYIPTNRRTAIVKGQTFATVEGAIKYVAPIED